MAAWPSQRMRVVMERLRIGSEECRNAECQCRISNKKCPMCRAEKWRQAARNRPRTVPEPDRRHSFWERHLGTDGLFTSPPLRQPGNLELTRTMTSPSQTFETHSFA